MYLLGINGSMRKDGNTNILIDTVFKSAKKEDSKITSKILQMSELDIKPCKSCYEKCCVKPCKCVIKNDDLAMVCDELKAADAVVIGSPLYFNIPSRLTALLERLICLSYFYQVRGFKGPEPLENIPCGLISVSAGNDTMPVLQHLMNFVLFVKMKPVFIKSYPYIGISGRGGYKDNISEAKEMGALLVKSIVI
jgi:multimeric flavodoxin WrbA